MPNPNPPRQGVVTAVDTATADVTATVDGVSVVVRALGELPEVGWTVWIEKRGKGASDWVIVQTGQTAVRRTFSRYKFTKTANGVASGGFVDVGTPDNTPWSTGAAAANISTITMTRDAWISVYCDTTGSFALLTNVFANSPAAVSAQTQGGAVFNQAWMFAGLLLAGETITIGARNTAAGLDNMVARTVMTFADAAWLVAEL